MTQYELPDGFEGMETAPKRGRVNVVDEFGHCGTDVPPFATLWVGWAPIVPLKKKARYIMIEVAGGYGPYAVWDTHSAYRAADRISDRDSAQRIADIYNEVML